MRHTRRWGLRSWARKLDERRRKGELLRHAVATWTGNEHERMRAALWGSVVQWRGLARQSLAAAARWEAAIDHEDICRSRRAWIWLREAAARERAAREARRERERVEEMRLALRRWRVGRLVSRKQRALLARSIEVWPLNLAQIRTQDRSAYVVVPLRRGFGAWREAVLYMRVRAMRLRVALGGWVRSQQRSRSVEQGLKRQRRQADRLCLVLGMRQLRVAIGSARQAEHARRRRIQRAGAFWRDRQREAMRLGWMAWAEFRVAARAQRVRR